MGVILDFFKDIFCETPEGKVRRERKEAEEKVRKECKEAEEKQKIEEQEKEIAEKKDIKLEHVKLYLEFEKDLKDINDSNRVEDKIELALKLYNYKVDEIQGWNTKKVIYEQQDEAKSVLKDICEEYYNYAKESYDTAKEEYDANRQEESKFKNEINKVYENLDIAERTTVDGGEVGTLYYDCKRLEEKASKKTDGFKYYKDASDYLDYAENSLNDKDVEYCYKYLEKAHEKMWWIDKEIIDVTPLNERSDNLYSEARKVKEETLVK